MAERDIVVIGASAGGVEALSRLVAQLPEDLPAAVFVVLHVSNNTPSVLPSILSRAGTLPARHPMDGEPIQRGHIYVAPPDHHLLLRESGILLTRGPRENGHRPAIDPTMRSAAVLGGPRTIGVVLSGALDDGTAGLAVIKRMGGTAIAQNPAEASFPSMLMSAIENVAVDHVLYVREIAQALARLTRETVTPAAVQVPNVVRIENEIAAMEPSALQNLDRPGVPAPFSCPDCNGTLFEIDDGKVIRFRCRVGHGFSAGTLAAMQSDVLETTLWSAMVALKEKAAMATRMVAYMRGRGHELGAVRFEQQAMDANQRANMIQDLLERGQGVEQPGGGGKSGAGE